MAPADPLQEPGRQEHAVPKPKASGCTSQPPEAVGAPVRTNSVSGRYYEGMIYIYIIYIYIFIFIVYTVFFMTYIS